VNGTRHTLDFTVACGAKKFLLTSSGAVYGKQPAEMTRVPEDYTGAPNPLDPASAYGEGKRIAELLCALYHRQYSIEPKIARCFAFVGPYLPLNAHFAIGNFIRDALAGGPVRVNGDGTPYRSYLYAADLAIWLWTILLRGGACCPYNVGSENALTISALANIVAGIAGLPVSLTQQAKPELPPMHYVPNTTRAREKLGLYEMIEMPESIRRTGAWHSTDATSGWVT
jgi:dTDP-glucose 4,6-dehydratase